MTERFIPRSPVSSVSVPRFKLSLGYTMRIDRGAQRWMYQHALRNHWRVSDWYDVDDLVQEGLICWHKVATHYRDSVKDRPHMMRLFQTTYRNRLHRLAEERTKRMRDWQGNRVDEQSFDAPIEDEDRSGQSRQFSDHGEQAADIELAALMVRAPEPLRRLFALVHSDDGARRLRALYRQYANGTRETFNDRVARLIGLTETPDFYQMLREYLGE